MVEDLYMSPRLTLDHGEKEGDHLSQTYLVISEKSQK